MPVNCQSQGQPLNPTTSNCVTVNWNALYGMHSMLPCVVLYSGEPIVLYAGEPINCIRQCEIACLRKLNRLDEKDLCHNVVPDDTPDMLQLDHAYLDFISADEHNLTLVTDQMDTLLNHLDNDGLIGLQLRMLPIGCISWDTNRQIFQSTEWDDKLNGPSHAV